ncbi:hypothetical protein QUV00_23015, partial [Xanthomonas citri pv. citri]
MLSTHGETVDNEALRDLTPDELVEVSNELASRKPWHEIPRQRLSLALGPLTHIDASTFDLISSTAADPNNTRPSISTLHLEVSGLEWQQLPTLLDSEPDDEVYRVEISDDGVATVVFGNDCNGSAPDETEDVFASYRIGV